MGLLPDALTHTRLIDLIPADSLAETIVDIVQDRVDNAGDTNPAIYNLVNPKPVPFAELTPTITSHLSHPWQRSKAGLDARMVRYVEEPRRTR